MAEYALVGPSDEIKTFASNVTPEVDTKRGWRWLPVERTQDPFDPEAETLEPETTTVAKNRVVVNRPARPKTDEELEQEKTAQLDDTFPPSLLSLLTALDNRVRALEGKPACSVDEFRSAARQFIA